MDTCEHIKDEENSLATRPEVLTHTSKRKSPLGPLKVDEILEIVESSEEDENMSLKKRNVLSASESESTKVFKSVKKKKVMKRHSSVNTENMTVRRSSRVKTPTAKLKTAMYTSDNDQDCETPNKKVFNGKRKRDEEGEVDSDCLTNGLKKETEMSEFELERKKNIEERMKLFQELQINETNLELQKVSTTIKKKQTIRFPPPNKSPVIRRKSLRLEGVAAKSPIKDADSQVPTLARSRSYAPSYQMDWGNEPRKDKKQLELSEALINIFNADDCKKIMTSWSQNVTGLNKSDIDLKTCSLQAFKSRIQKLSLKEYNKIKVTRERIYSLAVHPTFNGILIAAGSKNGTVGLWSAAFEYSEWAELNLMTLNHHVRPTSCVSFGEYDSNILHTTSYDGTTRRLDLNTQTLTLLHATDEDARDQHLNWHCEISRDVMLIAQGDGHVAKVDIREPTGKATLYHCHERSLRTLSLHPVTKQHIATTSSKNRVAAIWDIRKMSPNKYQSGQLSSVNFSKAITSAFFSPVTGNKLLTSSYDDNISVFSCSDLTNLKLESKIHHCTQTGRWTTNFKAQWHPQREDVFIVGSMERPRRVEIFEVAGDKSKLLTRLQDREHLTTIGAVSVFHPTIPAVVAANSSGYVHLFW